MQEEQECKASLSYTELKVGLARDLLSKNKDCRDGSALKTMFSYYRELFPAPVSGNSRRPAIPTLRASKTSGLLHS